MFIFAKSGTRSSTDPGETSFSDTRTPSLLLKRDDGTDTTEIGTALYVDLI